MTSVIRLNHFISVANQIYSAPVSHCLMADVHGLGVSPQPLARSTISRASEDNKRTWRVFKESLIGTIGQKKFDWICQRYRSRINFTHLERSGRPLLPKHVELFSIGSSQLLSRDIKNGSRVKLKTMTRSQLQERIRTAQPFPIVGNYIDPVNISGPPGTLAAHFIHDKLLMDKEKQLLSSDAEWLSFPAWQERFSMVTVNRELIEGQVIPVPGLDGHLDHYKVHRKIATVDGLVAYALKPAASDSTLKPMIVFRPTQWALSNEDAFATYLNDAQPSVGEIGWNSAKDLFDTLMKEDTHFRRNNEKISISGYSLGGAYAQRFLAVHHENVAHAVFYNDPSIDNATAERFAEEVNQLPHREPLNIQIFRTKGDFCHCVGEKHVGWGVNHVDVNIQLLEIGLETDDIPAFHSHRIFDNTRFPYQIQRYENPQELLNHLDNTQRGDAVLWYEKMRALTGGIAFFILTILHEIIKFVTDLLGVKILRSSRDPS